MLEIEAKSYSERILQLEKRVKQQDDELICLKSSLADVIRRLDKYENQNLNLNSPRNSISIGNSKKTTNKSATKTQHVSPQSTASVGSLVSSKNHSSSNSSLATEKSSQTQMKPTSAKKTTTKTSSIATTTGDNYSVKLNIRGKSIHFQLPNDNKLDVNKPLEAPKNNLELNWVYGYRGKDCRSNLYQLDTGEMIYFIAATVILHNYEENIQRHYREHTDDIKCLAIHPDRVTIATGQVTGKVDKAHIRIWNSVNLTTIRVIGSHENLFTNSITCLTFSKFDSGHQLCCVDDSQERIISVWNWQNGNKIVSTKCYNDLVFSIDYHPTEKNLIVSCGKQHILFWTIDASGHLTKKLGIFDGKIIEKPKYILCTSFLYSGEIISGDSEGNLIIWNHKDGKIVRAIKQAHDGGVFSILALNDTNLSMITGGGKDGRLIEWSNKYEKTGRTLQIPEQNGSCRFISHGKGNLFLIGTTKNCILKGNFDLGLSCIVSGHYDELWGLSTHPQDLHFITCGNDKTLIYWDILTHTPIWSINLDNELTTNGDIGGAHCVDFHPTLSHLIAIGFTKPKWCIFDLIQRKQISIQIEGSEQIECVAFSPNGCYLACGSRDNFIYIYNVSEDGLKYSRIGRCTGHSSFITHIDWSNDSQYLMSNSGDYEVLYWQILNCKQLTNSQLIRELEWKTHNCVLEPMKLGIWNSQNDGTDINAVCVSNSNDDLITVDDNGCVNHFKYPNCSLKSNKKSYKGHSSHVTNAKFLYNDSRLITIGGNDMAVFEWSLN